MCAQLYYDNHIISTSRLIIRPFRLEDAPTLHRDFGLDPEMSRYSGWNPYATPEMAEETVRRTIDSYAGERAYSWAIEHEGKLIGTVGAYDYDPETNSAEVGISIARSCWGRGFAGEVLEAVLRYLTENESIGRVSAWCAAENVGSARAMEKAGMRRIRTENNDLEVDGQTFDRLIYEYRLTEKGKDY